MRTGSIEVFQDALADAAKVVLVNAKFHSRNILEFSTDPKLAAQCVNEIVVPVKLDGIAHFICIKKNHDCRSYK